MMREHISLISSLKEKGFTEDAEHLFVVVYDVEDRLNRISLDLDKIKSDIDHREFCRQYGVIVEETESETKLSYEGYMITRPTFEEAFKIIKEYVLISQ